jgi:hypothetical protein
MLVNPKRLIAALRIGLTIWRQARSAAASTFRRPARRLTALLWLIQAIAGGALLLGASAARAETFDVAVRVVCPAAWNTALDRLDTSFSTHVDVPCAGIRVVSMDADPPADEYCGSAYIDSRGVARFDQERRCARVSGLTHQ